MPHLNHAGIAKLAQRFNISQAVAIAVDRVIALGGVNDEHLWRRIMQDRATYEIAEPYVKKHQAPFHASRKAHDAAYDRARDEFLGDLRAFYASERGGVQ